nr:MAG TPA: hypothetical protein [Caudoviricetes sp.]
MCPQDTCLYGYLPFIFFCLHLKKDQTDVG